MSSARTPAARHRDVEVLAPIEAVDVGALRVHLVAAAGVDDHQRARAPHEQRPHRHRDAVALVGRGALLPQRLRHDAEHRAAVEPEVAVEQRRELEVANSPPAPIPTPKHRSASASVRPARRARWTGWMNATSEPCAPSRGVSSIRRTPFAFSCASAARMSSTRSVMWCRPGPRFATYFAIGESSAVASSKFDRRLADRDEVRPHALRRDLLRRLDLEAERVAIERQGLRQDRPLRCRCDPGCGQSARGRTCRSSRSRATAPVRQ